MINWTEIRSIEDVSDYLYYAQKNERIYIGKHTLSDTAFDIKHLTDVLFKKLPIPTCKSVSTIVKHIEDIEDAPNSRINFFFQSSRQDLYVVSIVRNDGLVNLKILNVHVEIIG